MQVNNGCPLNFPAHLTKMYRIASTTQTTIFDYNQFAGIQLDPNNDWIRLANSIDWSCGEKEYAERFPSDRGRMAIPFRMVLGALIIQQRMQLSDRALIKAIQENPYYQYFVGLSSFTNDPIFTAPALVTFRKRIGFDLINKVNEHYLETAAATPEHKKNTKDMPPDVSTSNEPKDAPGEQQNLGTMISNATCSPVNIRYPQDFSLLEEARMKLDEMIDCLHKQIVEGRHPRTYREVLRKEYLEVAKAKRHSTKKMRALIRRQLEALKRNLAIVENYLQKGCVLKKKHFELLQTIKTLYAQQKEMFDTKKKRIDDRIVSITQPHIRPIVRGKTKTPVEFGAKYDVSIDEKGHGRLETISFDPYNECTVLQDAIERFHARTGHYPKKVLVDQIYRTKANQAFCKKHGIQMQGRNTEKTPQKKEEKKQDHKENIARIEVERFFSKEKRCCDAGLIMTKLPETTLTTIALCVFVANLFGIPIPFFCLYFCSSETNVGLFYPIEFEPL